MKTKIFSVLCLLMFIALTRLNAQNNQTNDLNKSVVVRGTSQTYLYYVYCGDVQIDVLECVAPFQNVCHYDKGLLVSCISRNFGEATSMTTGEHFRVKDIDRISITDSQNQAGFVIDHVNLMGDKGSHYIASCTYEFPSWKIISVNRANCPGYEK